VSWWKERTEKVCQGRVSLCWKFYQKKSEMDTRHNCRDHRSIVIRNSVTRWNQSEETRWPRKKEGSSNSPWASRGHGSLRYMYTGWTYSDTRSECSSWKWKLSSTWGNPTCYEVTASTTGSATIH
jgi:hypothetical protein